MKQHNRLLKIEDKKLDRKTFCKIATSNNELKKLAKPRTNFFVSIGFDTSGLEIDYQMGTQLNERKTGYMVG